MLPLHATSGALALPVAGIVNVPANCLSATTSTKRLVDIEQYLRYIYFFKKMITVIKVFCCWCLSQVYAIYEKDQEAARAAAAKVTRALVKQLCFPLTLPETNSSPLKMDGWNTSFFLGWPIFRCYVSFREGIRHKNCHVLSERIPTPTCNAFICMYCMYVLHYMSPTVATHVYSEQSMCVYLCILLWAYHSIKIQFLPIVHFVIAWRSLPLPFCCLFGQCILLNFCWCVAWWLYKRFGWQKNLPRWWFHIFFIFTPI